MTLELQSHKVLGTCNYSGVDFTSVETGCPLSNFRLACSRVLTDEGHP
jgi:hypothetical protein